MSSERRFRRIFWFATIAIVVALVLFYGSDSGKVDLGEASMPPLPVLAPEENAYCAIAEYAKSLPLDADALDLLNAFADGETNRVEAADAVKAVLDSDPGTVALVRRILASRGVRVPDGESLKRLPLAVMQERVLPVYKAKAVCEALRGDLAAARATVAELYRAGRFLMDSDGIPVQVWVCGDDLCHGVLEAAAVPPLAPPGDEAWLAKLREMHLALLDNDVERVKRALWRSLQHAGRSWLAGASRDAAFADAGYGASWKEPFEPLFDKSGAVVDRWATQRHEPGFVATELMRAVPGFEAYSFQPNRTLKECKYTVEKVCANLDAGYGNGDWPRVEGTVDFLMTDLFGRNWLGTESVRTLIADSCRASHKSLFVHRLRARASAAALACRSYRDRHGKWPERLEDLVPEFLSKVPRDGYVYRGTRDGNPLLYDKSQHFIWSANESDRKFWCDAQERR